MKTKGNARRIMSMGLWVTGILLPLSIQMKSERVALGSDEIFDILVDLNGGLLGALLFVRFTKRPPGLGRLQSAIRFPQSEISKRLTPNA